MRRFFMYVRLTWEMTKLAIASEMEYRITFVTKVIGMVINDFGLLLLWVIFFKKFPAVNGWQFHDMLLLYAIITVSFSLFGLFSGGTMELAKLVTKGELDYFLTLPKNVLWHVSVSKTEISVLGDFVFGVIMLFFAGPFSLGQLGVYVLVTLASCFLMYSFASTVQSLVFFFGNFEETAERWYWTLFGFSLYPQSVFSGWLKAIMLLVIPAFFVVSLPMQIIRSFDFPHLLLLLAATLGFFCLSVFTFQKGLRRYESGNLINVRV